MKKVEWVRLYYIYPRIFSRCPKTKSRVCLGGLPKIGLPQQLIEQMFLNICAFLNIFRRTIKPILIKAPIKLLFTDRVRSTTGRLCFDTCLSVCPQGREPQWGSSQAGVPLSSLGRGYPIIGWGVPAIQPGSGVPHHWTGGYPHSALDGGTPIQPYPHPALDGVPPSSLGQGYQVGVPPPIQAWDTSIQVGVSPIQGGMGYPPQGWGTPPSKGYPHRDGVSPQGWMGVPPVQVGVQVPPGTGQQMEHLICCGRYAACIHTGELPCFEILTLVKSLKISPWHSGFIRGSKILVATKMCQSRRSLLIAHWVHERILTSTFGWLVQKKWYGKPVTFGFWFLRTPFKNLKCAISTELMCLSSW